MLSRLKPKEVETLLGATGYRKQCVQCFKAFNCTGNCPVILNGFNAIRHGQCRCSHCINLYAFSSASSKKRCLRRCFLLEYNSLCTDQHPFKKRKPNHK